MAIGLYSAFSEEMHIFVQPFSWQCVKKGQVPRGENVSAVQNGVLEGSPNFQSRKLAGLILAQGLHAEQLSIDSFTKSPLWQIAFLKMFRVELPQKMRALKDKGGTGKT